MKIHARVTKEIEITEDQVDRLLEYLCKGKRFVNIDDIKQRFLEGENPGNYENGYVPVIWLYDDIFNQCNSEEVKNRLRNAIIEDKDIDLD